MHTMSQEKSSKLGSMDSGIPSCSLKNAWGSKTRAHVRVSPALHFPHPQSPPFAPKTSEVDSCRSPLRVKDLSVSKNLESH